MHRRSEVAWTYAVRNVAPTALVLGNVGMVQARAMGTDAVRALCDAVGADAAYELERNALARALADRGVG